MDGVIVDSEKHWKTLEGFFLHSLVPEWSTEHQGKITGLSVHDLYRMLKEEHGISHTKEEFLTLYHGMARQIYGEKVSLIEGFPQLLAQLREGHVRLALASSSPKEWIDMVLDRFDLRSAFHVVVSSDELEGEGKPSPAIYLLTARRLDVQPERCAVIEDSQNGVLSAK